MKPNIEPSVKEPTMPHGIILEPNYAVLRERFGREAKLQADTILADLLPEELIEIEHIKRIQAQVLRAIQAIIVPINICLQATDCNSAVLECRELVDAVSKTIIARADEIERTIEVEDDGGSELRLRPPTLPSHFFVTSSVLPQQTRPG